MLRRHSRSRSGLTFVELMAILAVILVVGVIVVPVSTGGHRAAYRAQHLSNLKQIATAEAIYESNNDDLVVPMVSVWDPRRSSCGPAPQLSVGCVLSWGENLLPYCKNIDLFDDAKHRTQPHSLLPRFSVWGMNHSGLNTLSKGRLVGINPAQIKSPVELISFASRVAPPDLNLSTILVHQPTGIPYIGNIEPPVGGSKNPMSIGGWGTDFWIAQGVVGANPVAASQGLLRRFNVDGQITPDAKIVVGFVDTHAKSVAPAELAAGTDCTDAKTDEPLLHPCKRTPTGTYLWGD